MQTDAQGEDSSLLTDTLASAAESSSTPSEETSSAKATDAGDAVLALAETKTATPAEQSLAKEAAEKAKTAMAPGETTAAEATSPSQTTANTADTSQTAAHDAGRSEPTEVTESQAQAEKQAPANGVQTASFSTSPRQVAFAAPKPPANRSSQSGGTIMRLFSDNRSKKNESIKVLDKSVEKKAVVASAIPKTSGAISRQYNDALPGVRENAGFEIKRRAKLDDDSDIDAHEEDDSFPVQLASAGGLARLAPNGLKVQRETVDVACLKPQLVALLKTVERHFGRSVMVTSGYRSPSRNRAVNGARRSLHMMCAAADIQIDGVSKREIARYVRSMPGRGGVGTYCHTKSVHLDIGPERDWNWRCVRRK
nr:YcbK family protein [Phyllobacterium phragmitis]